MANNSNPNNQGFSLGKAIKIGALSILAIIALASILGSFYQINQRERGIVLRNGAFVGIAQPGLNWKIPFIDDVVYLSLESHSRRFENMNAYSSDQQPADVRMSVNYHLDPSKIEAVYLRYRDIETLTSRVIDTHSPQEAKVVTGKFTASTSINDRGPLNIAITAALVDILKDEPVIIESVQVEDIKFSHAYEKSVEERMLAEVEVLKLRQNLDREKVQAEITVTKAKAEADSVAAQADGNAKATRLNAQADADATRLRGDAQATMIVRDVDMANVVYQNFHPRADGKTRLELDVELAMGHADFISPTWCALMLSDKDAIHFKMRFPNAQQIKG